MYRRTVFFCFLIVLLNCCFHGYHCILQLRFVQIISRHGDRSATVPYPGDPYQESIWPQGTGKLTTQGMQQMYRLGKFIRERYNGFISQRYDLHEWYTRSTDHDRTLMSAQSLLAGVFRPSGDQVWNEEIPWQPSAVHTIPLEEDMYYEVAVGRVPCPRYMQLLNETRETSAYKKENATFKDLYDFVLPYSGFNPPLTPVLMWNVWDTLNTQNLNNFTLPRWVTKEVMTVIPEEIIPFEYRSRFFPQEKFRLLAGVYTWTITNSILEWIRGSVDRRLKVKYISGHDDNILTLLIPFGAYPNAMIPYASAMFIELYEMKENEFAVALSLKNQTDSQVVHNLTIPGCDYYCPIEQFMKLTAGYSLHPDDHNEACRAETTIQKGDLIAVGVVGGIFLLIIILVLIIYCKRNSGGKSGYTSI